MNRWPAIREDFSQWLRTFPLLTNIGQPGESPEVVKAGAAPVCLDSAFWSERTHETEARARQHLSDTEIDRIFDEVAAVIDEDLRRFDALIAYFARFFPDGDPDRIEDERQVAHSVKRDLAWAAIERSIGEVGFFTGLLRWYERGRWPWGWSGEYPAGCVLVL
jgi:hypothetical protein